MANVPISLNNLKTKSYDVDVDKLKAILTDLKKLCNVMDNEFLKNKNSTH